MVPHGGPSGSPSLQSRDTSSARALERAKNGEVRAIDHLLARCLPQLRRWAHGRLPRWTRAMADTSDIVQDAVLHTLRKLPTLDLRGRRALAAYLRQAVQNRIRDEHRRFARRGTHEEVSAERVDWAPSPLDRVITAETTRRYRAGLARLSPEDCELIVGHVELDYSHEQLGCMSGRSANAARMALRRAIGKLAQHMRDG
ncbi:MAG: RNA polymerase sigma factor [Vicinamibacterales bacterium]